MCLLENAQHEKNLHTFNSRLICANKATRQLLCSSLLFCFRELNRFLEISVRDPWKILWVSRNSILETWFSNLENRNSILDSRKLRGSRIEFRVETVNLHLSGTVHVTFYTTFHFGKISNFIFHFKNLLSLLDSSFITANSFLHRVLHNLNLSEAGGGIQNIGSDYIIHVFIMSRPTRQVQALFYPLQAFISRKTWMSSFI